MTTNVLLPRYFTPPLSPHFRTHGNKFLNLLGKIYKHPQTKKPLVWDEWQRWLIRAVLERFPVGHPMAGQLRYRQVVIVLPRQSGKSLIASALGIYGLFLHVNEPNVIGIAGKREKQSKIVFRRVANVVKGHPALRRYLARPPSDDGMVLRNGGRYAVFPADSDAVQGEPVTFGIFDELHLARSPEIWGAMVIGQSAQDETMLVAITTAGDENSTSLLELQEKGRALAENPDPESRFGYFEWSAPDDLPWDSAEALLSCNPRIVCGAIPLARVMEENKELTKAEVERYRLCRTVASKSRWMEITDWSATARKWADLPADVIPTVASVEVSLGGAYGTICLAGVDDHGDVHGLVYESLPNPPTSKLVELLEQLDKEYPGLLIAADWTRGKELLERLSGNSRKITSNDISEGNAWFLRAVRDRKVHHDGSAILRGQILKAEAKRTANLGGYRIIGPNHADMDVAHSFINACYYAHLLADEGSDRTQLFVFPG